MPPLAADWGKRKAGRLLHAPNAVATAVIGYWQLPHPRDQLPLPYIHLVRTQPLFLIFHSYFMVFRDNPLILNLYVKSSKINPGHDVHRPSHSKSMDKEKTLKKERLAFHLIYGNEY
jgi:hypothetical protein